RAGERRGDRIEGEADRQALRRAEREGWAKPFAIPQQAGGGAGRGGKGEPGGAGGGGGGRGGPGAALGGGGPRHAHPRGGGGGWARKARFARPGVEGVRWGLRPGALGGPRQ